MVAFWLALTLPEVASNVTLFWPAGTMILAGTESNELLLLIDTSESAVAAAFKVTAHLPELLPAMAEGEQCSDLGCPLVLPWALMVKVLETPFKLAVSNAV
jgi:hypothetical protein